ncbi:MAG: hypothetical protein FWD39_00490 [Clostridiales bacterium]|nr:hypothetical protein [Clostridiales bacterium]
MIFVVGILLIVFGAIGLLSIKTALSHPIYSHRGIGLWSTVGGANFPFEQYVFLMMGCILAFGIFGVISAGNAAKARTIIIMGLIMCALLVIDLLVTIVLPMKTGFPGQLVLLRPSWRYDTISVTMLSFVLPILFIVGGIKNKRSLRSQS